MKRTAKNHSSTVWEWLLLAAIALGAFLLCCVAQCSADCLVFCSSPSCPPCHSMERTSVAQAKAEGLDIRTVDVSKDEAWRKMCRVTPTTFCIRETEYGCYTQGSIEGVATVGQLRRLAHAPVVTTVGAATRSAVRGAFGGAMAFVEW